MDKYVLILIESSAALLMFYAVYALWLSKETFFKENRYFLLIAAAISLFVPWLNFSLPTKGEALGYFVNVLDTITVTASGYEQKLIQQITASQWILITYLLGVLLMLLLFAFKTLQIVWIGRKAKKDANFPANVRLMHKEVAPFSFFKLVYINPEMHTKEELQKIIAHENVHISQGHTIDCLFYELLIALFWFNPIVYRYRKSAKAIHEYLADEGAIRTAGVSPKAYQYLLFEQATGIKELQLANSFNYSLIKKRMIMLTKIKSSKSAKLRLLAFVPVLLSVLLVFACQQTDSEGLNNKNGEVSKSEDGSFYNIVDDMPVFPGGDLELRKFIAMNVAYPMLSKEQGVEGRVFVQFVVNTDGDVEQAKVVAVRGKGIETEINEFEEVVVVSYGESKEATLEGIEALQKEAVRVISSANGWKPGYHQGEAVPVVFTVPINFQLN